MPGAIDKTRRPGGPVNEVIWMSEQTRKKLKSPEQLNDYLRVTSPGVWAVVVMIILMLLALLCWAGVGTLESRVPALVSVSDGLAAVTPLGVQTVEEGMLVIIEEKEYEIRAVIKDEYDRPEGQVPVSLPNGEYEATLITERIRPLSFLTESR